MDTTPTTPTIQRKPFTPEELVDLRRKVLAGEEVSNEDLRHALATLASARATQGGTNSPPKAKSNVIIPKIDVASRFAAFKAARTEASPLPSGTSSAPDGSTPADDTKAS